MRIGIVSRRDRIVLICLVATLVGCGGKTTSSTLPVVASTNVYGDIARQIGGAHVDLCAQRPEADPHLFDPGTPNGPAVAQGRVVIENGPDYDALMARFERSAPTASAAS